MKLVVNGLFRAVIFVAVLAFEAAGLYGTMWFPKIHVLGYLVLWQLGVMFFYVVVAGIASSISDEIEFITDVSGSSVQLYIKLMFVLTCILLYIFSAIAYFALHVQL